MEWRWITWRKLNSNNYCASQFTCTWRREICVMCVQHCYYVLRKKTGNFCYYYIVCYSVIYHAHTYLSVCLSSYLSTTEMWQWKYFFFRKNSKENSDSENKLFRHKVHTHVCILETAKRARWPMRALWLHGIKNSSFIWIELDTGISLNVGGPDFVVWSLNRRWLESFHRSATSA